jgi:hypothetical protein
LGKNKVSGFNLQSLFSPLSAAALIFIVGLIRR